MARPDKQGIEYYPKDVNLDLDDKLGMIIGEFQIKGELLYDKLLSWIYQHDGYFMIWEEDVQLRFMRRYNYCGFSMSFINEVVPRFIKWGLFDKAVFDAFQILTSKRIQKTWIDATRKRAHRKYRPEIWLIEVSSGLSAEETPKKAEETPQSKVNQSKVKESKVNNRAKALVPLGRDVSADHKLKGEYEKLLSSVSNSDTKIIWSAIKEFITTNKPEFIEPYVDAWNLFACSYKLARVEAVSETRKKKFKTRIQESAFDFIRILEKIKSSGHLKGDNAQGWKVTYDWIFENDNNYVKIIEGNY